MFFSIFHFGWFFAVILVNETLSMGFGYYFSAYPGSG